jgi:hypothetical protein
MRQLSIKLIGEVKSPKAYLIRYFLQRNGFAFQWIEVTTDAEAVSTPVSIPEATHAFLCWH